MLEQSRTRQAQQEEQEGLLASLQQQLEDERAAFARSLDEVVCGWSERLEESDARFNFLQQFVAKLQQTDEGTLGGGALASLLEAHQQELDTVRSLLRQYQDRESLNVSSLDHELHRVIQESESLRESCV